MVGIIFYVCLGLLAGMLSGVLGIGGGTIIIPALVFIAGFSQHQAQGTTLALMIPPIGLLAAMKYYMDGNVNIKAAALICIGFFIGGFFGAFTVSPIPDALLKKIFALFLIGIGVKMLF
ncbi:MAG: TSUP family transporter [Candidatus Omnitrophota bacterium]